jgi:catechol 2,3-dioxygenase-like lactoylglutathione lyase family enzyme
MFDHVTIRVADRAASTRFYQSGHRDNGAPGDRPQYHPGYYAPYVLDPDAHNVEAVFHGR